MTIDVTDSRSFRQSMLLIINVLKIDVLFVDVIELDVLGARPLRHNLTLLNLNCLFFVSWSRYGTCWRSLEDIHWNRTWFALVFWIQHFAWNCFFAKSKSIEADRLVFRKKLLKITSKNPAQQKKAKHFVEWKTHI